MNEYWKAKARQQIAFEELLGLLLAVPFLVGWFVVWPWAKAEFWPEPAPVRVEMVGPRDEAIGICEGYGAVIACPGGGTLYWVGKDPPPLFSQVLCDPNEPGRACWVDGRTE